MSVLEPFRQDVRAFLTRHNMPYQEFDRDGARDDGFCEKLFEGEKSFTTNKLERIADWMAEYDEDRGTKPPPRSVEQVDIGATSGGARDATFGEYDYDRRVELYKVMVQSAELGIDRRQALNRFYFSVFVAIFVSISFVIQTPSETFPTVVVVSAALVLGLLDSILWLANIFAARRLNASKYEAICELEKEFEYAPFTREWEFHVAAGRNFPQFTLIEILLPAALASICLVLFSLVAFGVLTL